ncbi:MAG: tRNA-dihydrouridine synthase family protein, partial [Chitinivibrionales bacterium]|nr:tRNA-dihydrouridine synthase family protein [Chitinivibrionales bacterium]
MAFYDNARKPLYIGALRIDPPLLCAPMAGLSHSALRRLLADFGGYGALYTEMLSARALNQEELHASPFTRRRPEEGTVIYQLLVDTPHTAAAAVQRLQSIAPAAIDINLGCPAPEVKKRGGGCA